VAQPIHHQPDPPTKKAGVVSLIAGNLARIIKPIPIEYEWFEEEGWLVTAFAGKLGIMEEDLHQAFLTIQEAIEMEFLDLRAHFPDRLTPDAIEWLDAMSEYLEEKTTDAP
jgi:hypothetical protein